MAKKILTGFLVSLFLVAFFLPVHGDDGKFWTGFAAKSFSYGSGTQEDPYLIGSPEELALLAKYVNMGREPYMSACYRQTADIDLAGHTWVPIGKDGANAFRGIYDGGGFSVDNMRINAVFFTCVGLIGVNRGTVKDLTLCKARIALTTISNKGEWLFAGVLCGACSGIPQYDEDVGQWDTVRSYAMISGCDVLDSSVDIAVERTSIVGGLCGAAYFSKIDSARVYASVHVDTGKEALFVGGAIGGVLASVHCNNLFADTEMNVRNDSSLLTVGKSYWHHCAGGLFGTVGSYYIFVDAFVTAEEDSNFWNNMDISLSNCQAIGRIHSEHIENGSYQVGEIMGEFEMPFDRLILSNLVGEVYIKHSGGDRNSDYNATGSTHIGYYDFWEDTAEECIVQNFVQKDYSCPGFTTFHESYDSLDNSIFIVIDNGQDKHGENNQWIARTGADAYACMYYDEENAVIVETDDFAGDILHLPERYWVSDGPSRARLRIAEDVNCLLHTWDKGAITRRPLCTEEGERTYTCIVCGETRTETVSPTGHRSVPVAAVLATCVEDGMSEGTRCAFCGEVLSGCEPDPAGHVWNEGSVTKEPTGKEDGIRTFSCYACGEITTEVIPAEEHGSFEFPHQYDVVGITRKATFEKEGEAAAVCRICGEQSLIKYGEEWKLGDVDFGAGAPTARHRKVTT